MKRSKEAGLLEVFDEEKKEIDSRGHQVYAPHVVQSINSHLRFLQLMAISQKEANDKVYIEQDLKTGALNKDGKFYSISHADCRNCGEHVGFELHPEGIIVASEPCKYPGDFPIIETFLEVPSGEIVLFNNLRKYYVDRNDKEFDAYMGHYTVNSMYGHKLHNEFYASKGMAIAFVGNSCPGVYQVSPTKLQVGYEPEECEGKMGKEIGSICTDLWWFCAVDRGEFEKRIGKTTTEWEEEYHKTGAWPELVIAKVEPGRYRVTEQYHLARGDFEQSKLEDDTTEVFSVIEKV